MKMANLTELGAVMHEEHFRILVLICGLENRITGIAATRPIDPAQPEDRLLLEELIRGLDGIVGHNDFEEAVLFPLLKGREAGDLAALLAEEHVVMGPLARRLKAVTTEIIEEGTSPLRWEEFREATRALITHQITHLQKEESAVVQQLRLLLDPDLDHELAVQHKADRHTGDHPAGAPALDAAEAA
jgi:hemerythrin-like domain-containing protein